MGVGDGGGRGAREDGRGGLEMGAGGRKRYGRGGRVRDVCVCGAIRISACLRAVYVCSTKRLNQGRRRRQICGNEERRLESGADCLVRTRQVIRAEAYASWYRTCQSARQPVAGTLHRVGTTARAAHAQTRVAQGDAAEHSLFGMCAREFLLCTKGDLF